MIICQPESSIGDSTAHTVKECTLLQTRGFTYHDVYRSSSKFWVRCLSSSRSWRHSSCRGSGWKTEWNRYKKTNDDHSSFLTGSLTQNVTLHATMVDHCITAAFQTQTIYRVAQKSKLYTLLDISTNWEHFLKILSLLHSAGNLQYSCWV